MTRIKLLLVDDEEEYVTTLAERLCLRQVDCRVAFSGEEAIAMVEEEVPDLMVVDLRLPGIGGLTVLERVKKKHPHVAVIILTGDGSRIEEEEARRMGADRYLQKPADIQRLLDMVRGLVPAPSAS